MTSQRLRITFATRRTLAYVSVLDLGRVWERTLRRARVPLRYSQGFNPRPKLQFALPLPTGCGGEAEWLDLWLEEPWTPAQVEEALAGQTPPDLHVIAVTAVAEDEEALFERVQATEYRALLGGVTPDEARATVARLLAAESLPRPRRGRRRHQTYDLRPLVEALRVTEEVTTPFTTALEMRLTARPGATGRPDELLAALCYADLPHRCTRLRILLEDDGRKR